MIDIKIDSNLKNFVGEYNTWLRRVQPRERECINEKMAMRGRTALIRAAKKANIKSPHRFIFKEVNRRGIQITIGAGRSGRGRGANFDRTAQLLQLAATGGVVHFKRNRSRIKGLWILKDKRFSLNGAFRKMEEVRQNGVRRISGSTTIWFGSNGFMLVTSPKGTTLFRRNKSSQDRAIIYLPAKARFKKRFDAPDTIAYEINRFLDKDVEKCFEENTLKHFTFARRR